MSTSSPRNWRAGKKVLKIKNLNWVSRSNAFQWVKNSYFRCSNKNFTTFRAKKMAINWIKWNFNPTHISWVPKLVYTPNHPEWSLMQYSWWHIFDLRTRQIFFIKHMLTCVGGSMSVLSDCCILVYSISIYSRFAWNRANKRMMPDRREMDRSTQLYTLVVKERINVAYVHHYTNAHDATCFLCLLLRCGIPILGA